MIERDRHEYFKLKRLKLDHLKQTATGLDFIPAWLLRLTAPVFATPISQPSQSFNRSNAMEEIDHYTYPTGYL